MQEERNAIKKDLFNKKEQKLEDLESSHPAHIANNEKVCSEENTKGWINTQ